MTEYFETNRGPVAKDSAGNWRKFSTDTGKFGQFAPEPPSDAVGRTWSAPQAAPSPEPHVAMPPSPNPARQDGDGKNVVIAVLLLALSIGVIYHFNPEEMVPRGSSHLAPAVKHNPCDAGGELRYDPQLGRDRCFTGQVPNVRADRNIHRHANCPGGYRVYFDTRPEQNKQRCWPEDRPLPSWAG